MSKFGANIFWIATTYFQLATYGPQQFAKISIFKVDNFVLPIFLLPKLRSVAQIEWKNTHIFFSTFCSKINEFGRKK